MDTYKFTPELFYTKLNSLLNSFYTNSPSILDKNCFFSFQTTYLIDTGDTFIETLLGVIPDTKLIFQSNCLANLGLEDFNCSEKWVNHSVICIS